MDTDQLGDAEKILFADVQNGRRTIFKKTDADREIRAILLRHIILGLPVDVNEGGILLKAATLLGLGRAEPRCAVTGVGISLEGAVVKGRLDLDSARGQAGGPLCPLAFTSCRFTDGLSARHAHFSRLGFSECRFGAEDRTKDCDPAIDPAVDPTIDLAGARLDGQLDMDGIAPEVAGDLLWISAPGLRVGGGINLTGCTLRAPATPATPCPPADTVEPEGAPGAGVEASDALDLTLARIKGDFSLDGGGKAHGRLKLRGTKVYGDVWLDSATLENPGEKTEALFLQGACIDGFLSMQPSRSDPAATFKCTGNIDLTATEVGRSLIFKRATLNGDVKGPDLIVRDDFFLHAVVKGEIDLERSRIGGSFDIADLRLQKPPPPPPRPGKPIEASEPAAQVEPGAPGKAGVEAEPKPALSLKDGTIGGALRLISKEKEKSRFEIDGIVDLTGLSCDTLDDEIGQRWGKSVRIRMNHFIYRRTGWLHAEESGSSGGDARKTSQRIVGDWLLSWRAEGPWPWRLLPPRSWLPKSQDFWDSWQLRRNWIYQQYESDDTRAATADPFLSMSRHWISEQDYRPQPFEQAIRVARAEGREDFATHFEMHKQKLEWRFVNRRVRWPLGIVGIAASSLWLASHPASDRSGWPTLAALAVTVVLMVLGSAIRDTICRPVARSMQESRESWLVWLAVEIALLILWGGHSGSVAWLFGFSAVSVALIPLVLSGTWVVRRLLRPAGRIPPLGEEEKKKRKGKDREWVQAASSKVLTWLIYWMPAILLLGLTEWYDKPFHYLVGFAIFAAIRLMAVAAHAVMRFGFGYMRRPIYAVTTLIVAFIVGWWGVHFANQRGMLVIDAQPVADLAMPDNHAAFPEGHRGAGSTPVLMGSRQVPGGEGYVRELPCGATISEPLYALDVLVPIIDLREERSCEIRRVAAPASNGEHGAPAHAREEPDPGQMNFSQLRAAFPELALDNHRFWWWVKAIYALFGWIIVSLSILTFAQVNKIHAEPPTEHK